MLTVTQRAVYDLMTARTQVEQELKTAEGERALRNLLHCAKQMREACETALNKQQLRYALSVPLIIGIFRKHGLIGTHIGSEAIYGAFDHLSNKYLADLGKKLVVRLDIIVNTASYVLKVNDNASRIKDFVDYQFTMLLANQWLKRFGVNPTFVHLDKEEDGVRIFEPSPFQAFVTALPLDRPIKDEVIRTAVEFTQEIARQGGR